MSLFKRKKEKPVIQETRDEDKRLVEAKMSELRQRVRRLKVESQVIRREA